MRWLCFKGVLSLFNEGQDAHWIGVSIISQIEFLAFSGLSQEDRQLFEQFLQRVEVVNLVASDAVLIKKIIEIR